MDNFLKTCFADDEDEEEAMEKNKNKYHFNDNKNPYNQNQKKIENKNKHKNDKRKEKRKKRKNYSTNQKLEKPILSDNFILPVERRVSIDVSKYKLEHKKYKKEDDFGNIEYKWKLCNVSKLRFEELKTGMNFRLHEKGYGECFYEIGVADNGEDLGITLEELNQTVSLLNFIANDLGCQTKITKLIEGKQGYIAELYIRDNNISKTEITIGVLGEEGTGKSTLIGVLKNGKLDDGHGSARLNILKHKHEKYSGKTSSFSHQILGFDEKGDITNYDNLSIPDLQQIVHKSTKIINFYDMAGSAKTFNRTTLSNLSN